MQDGVQQNDNKLHILTLCTFEVARNVSSVAAGNLV